MSPLLLLACKTPIAAKDEYEAALAPDWLDADNSQNVGAQKTTDNFKVRLGASDIEITHPGQASFLKPYDANGDGLLEDSDLTGFPSDRLERGPYGGWSPAPLTVAAVMAQADLVTDSPYSQYPIGEQVFASFAEASLAVAQLKEFTDKYNQKTRVFNTTVFGVTLAQSGYLGCDGTQELYSEMRSKYNSVYEVFSAAYASNALGALIFSLSFSSGRQPGEYAPETFGQACDRVFSITYDEGRIPEFLRLGLRKMVYDYMTSALWLGQGSLRVSPECEVAGASLRHYDGEYVTIERGEKLEGRIRKCSSFRM